MIDVYDVYEDDKFRVRFTNLDMAKEFCIQTASNNVEGLKRKIYYPILREKYGVEKIKDIPAEIRYKYWDDEKLKYLILFVVNFDILCFNRYIIYTIIFIQIFYHNKFNQFNFLLILILLSFNMKYIISFII